MFPHFPHEVAYLSRTKLSYINLPRLLSEGKRDRTARVPGFVVVQLGAVGYLIFVHDGEPFQAVRWTPEAREAVSLPEVLRTVMRAIEHGESGWIGYYGAPEEQLRAMLATMLQAPLAEPYPSAHLPPERIFLELEAERFSGVVELLEPPQLHYLCIEGGECRAAFYTPQIHDLPVSDWFAAVLRNGVKGLRIRAFAPLVDLKRQASPGQINLYRRTLQRLTHRLVTAVGPEGAAKYLRAGRRGVRGAHPAVSAFRLVEGGWALEGAVVTPEELRDAVAAWIAETLAAAVTEETIDPAEMLQEVTRDDRFALTEEGFFDSLPWPVPF